MDYATLNDYELVYFAQEDNEDAMDILYEKYLPLMYKKCRRILPKISNMGIELSDLIQECVVGFKEAVDSFNESDNVTFYTFCNLCIDRQLSTEIARLNRIKYKALNDSIPLDILYNNGDEVNIMNIFSSFDNDPLNSIVIDDIVEKVRNKLTKFERRVFDLRLLGFDYKYISLKLNKDIKAIDNALFRIKFKIKKILIK